MLATPRHSRLENRTQVTHQSFLFRNLADAAREPVFSFDLRAGVRRAGVDQLAASGEWQNGGVKREGSGLFCGRILCLCESKRVVGVNNPFNLVRRSGS